MSSPFSDLRQVLSQLPAADTCAAKKIDHREPTEASPGEIVGDGLLELKKWLAIWQGSKNPDVAESHICILASSYDGADNLPVKKLISDAASGKAAVNKLCVDRGVGLRVLELAPDLPHSAVNGWSEAECMAAVAFGMEATAAGGHLLALSDIAPGNKAIALAIVAACIDGAAAEKLRDLKTGCDLSAGGLLIVEQAEALLLEAGLLGAGALDDALGTMRLLGGREIAASVGAIVAARSRRLPVVIDGWAALAALAILERETSGSTDHVKIASCDSELARAVICWLGKKPLLQLAIGSGPGCGSAISVSLLKAACDI